MFDEGILDATEFKSRKAQIVDRLTGTSSSGSGSTESAASGKANVSEGKSEKKAKKEKKEKKEKKSKRAAADALESTGDAAEKGASKKRMKEKAGSPEGGAAAAIHESVADEKRRKEKREGRVGFVGEFTKKEKTSAFGTTAGWSAPITEKDRKAATKEAKQAKEAGAPAAEAAPAASAYTIGPDGQKVYPPPPPGTNSILLFYAYCKPEMTRQMQDAAIAWAFQTMTDLGITGRMRVAREGYNSTLTGPSESIRALTAKLRAYDPATFGHYLDGRDFKYVDHQRDNQLLKGLKVRLRCACCRLMHCCHAAITHCCKHVAPLWKLA